MCNIFDSLGAGVVVLRNGVSVADGGGTSYEDEGEGGGDADGGSALQVVDDELGVESIG